MLTQTLRPFRWDELVGQKGIVKEMKKRSKTMDYPEVMLFEGASGTGKSTMAFIIAALLSDSKPLVEEDGTKNPNPESPSSKAILDMKFNRDVIYKDASNMSKDDVLDLQRDIANSPMFDKAKVVIIDECFRGDTLVLTDGGWKRIDSLAEGDMVQTREGYKSVLNVMERSVPIERLVRVLTSNSKIIYTTVEHPFYVNDEWVPAGDLKVGDKLTTIDGKFSGVIGVTSVTADDVDYADYTFDDLDHVKMYDIEVEDAHEFYAEGVLVHNCQELSKAGKGATLALLEKKRKNTYIILCTMNEERLDKAVKSRAAVYSFKSPSSMDIAELLMTYTDENHLNIPLTEQTQEFFEKGLFLLAENCEGSVRMAVQNFERCIQGEFYTQADIEREFNIISTERLNDLIVRLCNRNPEVVKEILTFGSKDFYYKLMKVMGDAYLYSRTGYTDAPWKKSIANKLSSSLDLLYTIEEMKKSELNGFYREDLFLVYLSHCFFDSNKTPTGITATQPTGTTSYPTRSAGRRPING